MFQVYNDNYSATVTVMINNLTSDKTLFMEEVGPWIQSYLFEKCSRPVQIEMHHSRREETSICNIRE